MDVIAIDLQNQAGDYTRWLCEQLERGHILTLADAPFLPTEPERAFLREQQQSSRKSHKNIAYKPFQQRMTGADIASEENAARLRTILAAYSQGAVACLSGLFPHYARVWRVDYASFRPVEEEGRALPIRHRNDLLHLDAFPTRPTHGGRILRAFTNLHPTRDRVWATTDSFEDLATRYAVEAGLKNVTGFSALARHSFARVARLAGMRVPDRSPYDQFMLRFHHYLKSNTELQERGRREKVAFPPGTTWISFTDQVAHAVVSGQYALEQTCIVPYRAMLLPELAPVAVLERLAGRTLAAPPPLPLAVGEKPEQTAA